MISLSGNRETDAVLPAENARHVFKTCSEVLTVEAEDSLLVVVPRLAFSRGARSNFQPGVRSKPRLPQPLHRQVRNVFDRICRAE